MKKNLFNLSIVFLIILVGSFLIFYITGMKNYDIKYLIKNVNSFIEIDSCLDRGGCWDYIRHRCEMDDQGYCERNEKECIERHGLWEEDKKYCNLQDN